MSEENTAQLSDEQIDSLVDGTGTAPSADIPMTAEDAKPTEGRAASDVFHEFNHNGKSIRATTEQLIKWAQQGYDYPQKMGEFNKTKMAFETQQKEYDAKYAPYMQIDEWASKNPTQWQSLEQAWKQSQNSQAPAENDPYAPKFQTIEQKLSQIEQFANTVMQERAEKSKKEQDTKLSEEIKSIREQYKDLDFDSLDENGKSLEYKVFEYAKANGIGNFKTAFRDFYHDNLIERAQAQAKLAVSKGIQTKSKMGVLGSSPTPKRGLSEVKNPRNQSYEDLAQEALDELRAGA